MGRRGIYYLQSPEVARPILDVERYAKRLLLSQMLSNNMNLAHFPSRMGGGGQGHLFWVIAALRPTSMSNMLHTSHI